MTHHHLPSPMNFWTSSEPDTLMKVQSVWWATALASRVFPVPGGPYRSTPLGAGERHNVTLRSTAHSRSIVGVCSSALTQ